MIVWCRVLLEGEKEKTFICLENFKNQVLIAIAIISKEKGKTFLVRISMKLFLMLFTERKQRVMMIYTITTSVLVFDAFFLCSVDFFFANLILGIIGIPLNPFVSLLLSGSNDARGNAFVKMSAT